MTENNHEQELNREDPDAMADALVYGLLSEAEAAQVRGRVAESAVWKTALDGAYARHAAVLSVACVEPSAALVRRVLEAIPDRAVGRAAGVKRRARVLRSVGGVFALAAVVIMAFNVHFVFMRPSATDVRVVAPAALLAGSRGAVRIALFDGASNAPVAGKMVRVTLERSGGGTREFGPFETDATGACRAVIDVPDWDDDACTMTVSADGERVARSVKVARAWRVMLSTDKPVYQPGQSILMRTLTLGRAEGQPVAGREVVFTLADPRGTVLFKQRGVTSEFGIASTECPLAVEIGEGAYTLAAAVGETRSESTVQIKRYVLPKYSVEVTLDKAYYGPGEMVKGAVHAAYFFGKSVAGSAEVEFAGRSVVDRVTRLAPIALDGQGRGVFEFRLPERLIGDEREGGDARVDIAVTVRDTAGQEQGRTLSRVVTARALRVAVIPESNVPLQGATNRLYVLVTTPDGQPVRATVGVSGLDRGVETSELGVATVEWIATGQRQITVTANTDDGRSASAEVGFEGEKGGAAAFLLRTDRAVYDAGETVRVTALGEGAEPLFVDFIKDGQILLTREVVMGAGTGSAEIDLPAELAGTLELSAYRYDANGLPVRQSRVLVVRPASGLRVTVTGDRPEYRPGEEASLSLVVTDDAGNAVPSAVSLAAVDEAVYSVMDQRPGMERVFFSLDRELLKPALTLYSWNPFAPGEGRGGAWKELGLAMSAAAGAGRGGENGAIRRAIDEGWMSEEMVEELRDPASQGRLGSMVNRGVISEATAAAIRGDGGDPRLVATRSFPQRRFEFEAARRQGLTRVAGAWALLCVAAVVTGLVLIAVYVSGGWAGALVVVLMVVLVAVMLPALGKARSSARGLRVDSQARAMGERLMYGERDDGTAESRTDAGPRVREWFPETLLWRPQIITDAQGRARLPVALADSITTWRLSGSAVSRAGALGSVEGSIRVFQPFFVDIGAPVALTRGDEVALPITVYNYLETGQEVRLTLEAGEWYELRGASERTISLAPNEVTSVFFRIRATGIGRFPLSVRALGAGVGDAIKREIEVVPDGTAHERVVSGSLDVPASVDVSLPAETIRGSAKLLVRIYPSAFSQLLDGLENIFRMPYGCFEQTSSTTYPNVLALEYLKRTGKSAPEVEAKARQYIHLGYQRLVGFEVAGGGFDWFGRPPASVALTAYGLMEFRDMARVHDVDAALIERTRAWLLERRLADGSWPDSGRLHADVTGGDGGERALAATAYVAWAVFGGGARAEAEPTLAYLMARDVGSIRNPHTVALVANALLAMRPEAAGPYVRRLAELAGRSGDGKNAWWSVPEGARTTFYGAGDTAAVETTALAALAFLSAKTEPTLTRGALAWIATKRDGAGTWGSTQATVLSLKALIEGTGAPLGGERARVIEMALDGNAQAGLTIGADQAEVMRLVNLSAALEAGPARLTLTEASGTGCAYQVVLRYYTPTADVPPVRPELGIDVVYDRMDMKDGDTVGVTATVRNDGAGAAPMLMVDLPVPPGFAPQTGTLDRLVDAGTIAKYEITARQVIVYLVGLSGGERLALRYGLRATMPVDASVPAARVYEYYNPTREAFGKAGRVMVR